MNEKRFTVVKLDILAGIAEEDEEEPGMFIGVNDNDSDESGEPDNTEAPLLSEDPDLVLITISVWPLDLPDDEMITLSGIENCYEDRRKMTNAASSYTMERVREGLTLYLEGAAPGEYTLTAQHPTSGAKDKLTYTVLRVALIPDWNHNRRIDDEDANQVSTNNPFRFWINDDADDGDISDGDSDVPGQGGKANHKNSKIDGRSDLTDFFPVWLDVGQILRQMPDDMQVECYLKQADDALNAVYSDLSRGSAGDFLIVDSKRYGPSFDKDSYNAPVFRVTAGGVKLSEEFVNKMKSDPNKGVLLLEGRATTQNPLILEIRLDGKVVTEARLPMSIDGVEKMYRWINLRPSGGLPTSTGEPSNNPDSPSNGKSVFFLHGFNVTADESRGWSAEVFKRLYWSGSRAKFWGMTWEGDVGLINALHYQEDVANALAVASNFNAQVSGISGDKIILGHSLGNMVVSGAIQDYGLSVNKYFMLDAAVATECYWPAAFNDVTTGNYMLHDDWVGYSNKTWCSKWFELFASPDDREKLTWKDRFPSVLSVAYNFYSSGDEIFETHADPGLFTGGLWHLERYAWQKQELFKGRGGLGGTDWAGWGFAGHWEDQTRVYEYTMAQANAATPDNLRTNAVFLHEPATMFSSNITAQVRNDIIAQGVPALSYAAGVNAITPPGWDRNYNANDHKPNGWGRSGSPYYDRWLHSDLKNMAYLYTYELFNELVSQGGLQ